MDECKSTRDEIVARFKTHAATLFAANPARRSAMLAIAQYWNDQANDEVHARTIASTRMTPVWPHECAREDDEARTIGPILAGEACWWCAGDDIDMDVYGGYGDATVNALELFCREGAHQSMSTRQAYLPFLVARRIGDGIDIEIVGRAERTPATTIGSAHATRDWPDARARALFDEVCRHGDDDGPRAVLSDYLLEAHPDDIRGEAIALALASDLDTDTRARRAALFTEHADRWMFPLGDVIAPGCAHFERGFLARADIFVDSVADRERVINAPAWGTLHTVRFARASRDLVAPTMHALRSIGPLRDEGCTMIARARRPWKLRHIRLEDAAHGPLLEATNLPALVHLELAPRYRQHIDALTRAPWWKQLERITFYNATDHVSFADWRALRVHTGVRELAVIRGGWQLGFRADDTVTVQWGEWHENGSLAYLAELATELHETTKLALVSTRERSFDVEDVAWLHAQTGRDIMLHA